MRKRYMLAAIVLAASVSGCTINPATEASIERAMQQAAEEGSHQSSEIYYDATTKHWRTPDGQICHTCTAEQGFPTPVVRDGDMYYDPNIKKWRQSSMKGAVCHTCTPEYGYPIPPTKGQDSSERILPEQRAGWCKNEVVGRYDTFQADVSIVDERGNKIYWEVDSKGKTGHCVFNKKNQFVKIVADHQGGHFKKTGEIHWDDSVDRWIAPDGTPCATCTPGNGFPIPPKTQDGFFYLPEERQWFDPDGKECASCTPENGFPVPAR